MYMNSTMFEFNKMSTVATTILASFAAAGIAVNHVRSWNEPYYATHMQNPFHEHVRETYRETRSEREARNLFIHIRNLYIYHTPKTNRLRVARFVDSETRET